MGEQELMCACVCVYTLCVHTCLCIRVCACVCVPVCACGAGGGESQNATVGGNGPDHPLLSIPSILWKAPRYFRLEKFARS